MTRSPMPIRGLVLAAAALVSLSAVGACAQERAAVPPQGVVLDSILPRAQRARIKGADGAPVTLVVVSDFQCPFCRQFTETTYGKLDSTYVQTGKVRLVFINFPLSIHAQAFSAAKAATCAGAQGRFWPMHDRLFASQREWSGAPNAVQLFEGYATGLRLDMPAYRDCTANDRTSSLIAGDLTEAAAGGVNGTPAFFMSGPGGRRPLNGAVPWEEMRTAIEAVLTAPATPPAPNP
jgi:protein-disulfide isomerase